tara:strand:+ start:359 stop:880 length:522 start_codon:yes stop_codon:yes gene_type:complete
MNNQEYINNITLEYLLNPVLYEKINNEKDKCDNIILNDIKFYKKRLCQLTKNMCKGEYTNENLKSVFLNYASTMIYYLKQLDEKDILQSDYNNLHSELSPIKEESSDVSLCQNIDNLMMNLSNSDNNLDNFIKRVNIKENEKIIPHKRVADIRDPKFKNKGVKNKKYNYNINE